MKTVKKTIDILEVFLDRGNAVSISELVEITGQNASTVHGILQELLQSGYIRQQQKRGKYSLGLKFLSFSDTIHKILATEDIVNPYLLDLNRELNETVNLAIRNGRSAVNIAIMHSTHELRVVSNEKVGTPLYCTGVGKVLLAGMANNELAKYLKSGKLTAFTPKTITDKEILKKQILNIREAGIAEDDEEYEIGVKNVAVPVKDHNGNTAAAIGIVGPSVRLTRKRIREISPIMKSYSGRISAAMGYRGHKT